MIKTLTILACSILMFSLCGCGKEKEKYEEKYKPVELENVSIEVRGVLPTGSTVVIKDTNEKPYTYSEWYTIEKDDNGKWKELKVVDEEYGFNSKAYKVDRNKEVKFSTKWSKIYGELPVGRYRLLKKVEDQYIAVIFNVTDMTGVFDFYVSKSEEVEIDRFKKYTTVNDRSIYMLSNIEKFNVMNSNSEVELKKYFEDVNQTFDEKMNNITNKLDLTAESGDLAQVYRSKEKDLTIVLCNPSVGSNSIFIGDYASEYFESFCETE